MNAFDPGAYGPTFAALLREAPLGPLDPGLPDFANKALLEALAGDDAFLPGRVADRESADACRAGLWLLYNFLTESHTLSQELHNADGAYWHALMHRREGDFSNSKYWFRRVGVHPIYAPLRDAAHHLAGNEFNSSSAWDPFEFVDLCEASLAGRSSCEMLCRRVQQWEWQLLFDYCYRRAIGQ